MSIETIYILVNIIMVFAACYLVCIGAFTYGMMKFKTERKNSSAMHPYFFANMPDSYRKVSVLIAARNEGKNIEKLLQSLYNQTYNKEFFEVILIDDNSTDNTLELSENFLASHPEMNLKIFKAAGNGKKQAVSQALHAAENKMIMVTDADCELPKRWIETMANYFLSHELKMLLGPVLLSPANTVFEKLQVLEHLSLIASTAGSAAIGMPVMCNGANMMYDRLSALEVESYRTDMKIASGDDMFLMEQFIKHYGSDSVKFIMDNAAVVKTSTMPDLKSFFRQRKRWASKTKAYTNWKIIATALTVFLFNFSIAFFFVAGFFIQILWLFFVLYVLMKTLIDLPILKKITTFMRQHQLMKWMLPLEFIYPFYVVFTAISGLFSKVKWK